MLSNLHQKIAVVFAATGELAGQVAQAVAEQGALVVVAGRRPDALQQRVAAIEAAGGRAIAAQVDLTDEQQIEGLLADVVGRYGRLDFVFNGIGLRAEENAIGEPSTTVPLASFLHPFQTIVGSQFLTARAAARQMMASQTPGTIVLLTASLSRLKLPFMTAITTACAAIEGLTRALAAEFGPAGIKVICLNPTSVLESRTIQESNAAVEKTLGIPAGAIEQNQRQAYLLRRHPSAQEVGRMAAFLASDTGALLNSHVVDVDLGNMMVI